MRMLSAAIILLSVSSSVLADEATVDAAQVAKDKRTVETLMRLPNYDVNANAKVKASVLRHLETVKGTPSYLELIERFQLFDTRDDLLELVLNDPASTNGVKATQLLVKFGALAKFQETIDGENTEQAAKAVTALGFHSGEGEPSSRPTLVTNELGLFGRAVKPSIVGPHLAQLRSGSL